MKASEIHRSETMPDCKAMSDSAWSDIVCAVAHGLAAVQNRNVASPNWRHLTMHGSTCHWCNRLFLKSWKNAYINEAFALTFVSYTPSSAQTINPQYSRYLHTAIHQKTQSHLTFNMCYYIKDRYSCGHTATNVVRCNMAWGKDDFSPCEWASPSWERPDREWVDMCVDCANEKREKGKGVASAAVATGAGEASGSASTAASGSAWTDMKIFGWLGLLCGIVQGENSSLFYLFFSFSETTLFFLRETCY